MLAPAIRPSRVRLSALVATLAGLAMLALAGVVRGQLARRGGEFPVNTVTDGNQRGARITPLPDGGFVVVWQSDRNVAARRFDANTQPLGREFQVNSTTTDYEPAPSVAAAPDGSLLVAWQSEMHPQSPPNETGIVAQRLDANVKRDGAQFAITQPPYLIGVEPSVAAIGPSEFVVVWNDVDNYYGRARIVSRTGEGPSFYVGDGNDAQYNPAVASNTDGSYRVVWYEEPFSEMQGRGFNGTSPTGDVFSIDSVSSGFHQGPAICTQESGDFVVAWATYGPLDYGTTPVSYRAFGASGVPLTPPLPVTPEESEPEQARPTVACGPGSAFVAVWGEAPLTSTDVRIRGRAFAPGGLLPSADFTIGLLDGADGDGASVARLTDGDLLVTWTDCGGVGACDIFGQRLTSSPASDCPGDCNRDGHVTVDELVLAVNIALDSPDAPLMKECLPADVNLDYLVTVDELVLAVNRALGGCS